MRPRTFLTLLVGFGLLLSALGCGGGGSSLPRAKATPFAATVATMVHQKTSDTATPDALESLDLSGADTEDEHAFDAVLGAR
jgi:hypothetical protein